MEMVFHLKLKYKYNIMVLDWNICYFNLYVENNLSFCMNRIDLSYIGTHNYKCIDYQYSYSRISKSGTTHT